MSWTVALGFLALGGCAAGVVTGVANIVGNNKNYATSLTLAKTEGEVKRSQFLKKLEVDNSCFSSDSLDSEEKQFGTIYFCSDSSLYYLEEESAFDWAQPFDNLKHLFKKVQKFNYKEEVSSKSYLLIDLGDGKEKKKVFLDSSYAGEDWSGYEGFTHDLLI